MLVLKPVVKMTALTGGAIAAAKANGLASRTLLLPVNNR